jgi:hypothetical protein
VTRFEIAEAVVRVQPTVEALQALKAGQAQDWFAEHGLYLPDLIALLREVDGHVDALMQKLVARFEHPSYVGVIGELPTMQSASRQHAIFFALALGLQIGRNGLE